MSFTSDPVVIQSAVKKQLSAFYDLSDAEIELLHRHYAEAYDRAAYCYSHIKNKYYQSGGICLTHSGQLCLFLYYYGNTIFRNRKKAGASQEETDAMRDICDKLYLLNKMTSCLDLFYEVEMPDIFFVDHPVGSVIGRAKAGNGLVVLQGCTLGSNGGAYPTLGEYVFLQSNAKILGDAQIGSNVVIAANAYVKGEIIPDNSLVFGQSPNLIIKENHADLIAEKIDRLFVR